MDPLLIEVPERIETERLVLRCPRPGDGPALNAAVRDSLADLRPWMPWAQVEPPLDESEAYCRRMRARFGLREDLPMLIFARDAAVGEGVMLGACGMHRIDWNVPRLEIGYWRRSGHGAKGVIGEAVHALNRLAFDRLGARRVEIRMDAGNARSARVAERAGFTFEGLLRQDSLAPGGEPRDTRVYSRVRGVEEADAT